jgi:hypothetical protein
MARGQQGPFHTRPETNTNYHRTYPPPQASTDHRQAPPTHRRPAGAWTPRPRPGTRSVQPGEIQEQTTTGALWECTRVWIQNKGNKRQLVHKETFSSSSIGHLWALTPYDRVRPRAPACVRIVARQSCVLSPPSRAPWPSFLRHTPTHVTAFCSDENRRDANCNPRTNRNAFVDLELDKYVEWLAGCELKNERVSYEHVS